MYLASAWLSLIGVAVLAVLGTDYATVNHGLHPALCTLGGAFLGAFPCFIKRAFPNF